MEAGIRQGGNNGAGEAGLKPSEGLWPHRRGRVECNKPQREDSSGCEAGQQEARHLHSFFPFHSFKNTNNKRKGGDPAS